MVSVVNNNTAIRVFQILLHQKGVPIRKVYNLEDQNRYLSYFVIL